MLEVRPLEGAAESGFLVGTCKVDVPTVGAEDEGCWGAEGVGGVRGVVFGKGVAPKVLQDRCYD
jgi:hypothetical protein